MKKWLGIFFASLGAFCLLIAAFNVAVDPFGIFGDRFLNYYEYNMTQNPRIAKISIGIAEPTPLTVLPTEITLPLSSGLGVITLGRLQNGTSATV